MISDKLTIVAGILEVLLFGGSVYGFSFLQTIMEKEFVYWKYFWKGSKMNLSVVEPRRVLIYDQRKLQRNSSLRLC